MMENDNTQTKRVMGIDWGERRVGIALSIEGGTAHAVPFIIIKNDKNIYEQLNEIISEERIGRIVIGLPLSLSGGETDTTRKVKQFGRSVKESCGIMVEYEDERWTSREIEQLRKDGLIKKSAHIDDLVAKIILQSYLERNLV